MAKALCRHQKRLTHRVQSDSVVVVAPLLDDDPCFLQAVEDLAVQEFGLTVFLYQRDREIIASARPDLEVAGMG